MPSDTLYCGLGALLCSDFVEVNRIRTAEVLRPAGAARSKGLGCCPTSLQGKRLCTYKDTACRCKALCKSTRLSVKV